MSIPSIKIIAVSNLFCRMMHFEKKGDIENGHKHNYDHATLVSSGSVLVEVLDDNFNTLSSKTFIAPNMVYIKKDNFHRLTALEDNTVCGCLHVIRTEDGDIIDPEFIVEPLENCLDTGELKNKVNELTGKDTMLFVKPTDIKVPIEGIKRANNK